MRPFFAVTAIMKEVIRLNNNWHYISEYREGMETGDNFDGAQIVNLPHTNIELPFNYFDEKAYQFVSCYRRDIHVKPQQAHKTAILRFEGVMTYAKVYLNGVYVGEHKGGYTPFELDVTAQMVVDNVLTVIVDSTEREDIPPFGGQIDFLTYGGIYREVSLTFHDKLYIENAQIKPMDVLEDEKSIEADVYIVNGLCADAQAQIQFALRDADGKMVYSGSETIRCKAGKQKHTMRVDGLKGIKLWDIDAPNLYSVEITLTDGDCEDTFCARIGFRTCEFTDKGFLLNGRNEKIVGLNRHQAYPYKGYAMPQRVQEKDADILKDELHVNLVRTAHYPQSEHFINRCDEIGLLVFEEIPGWQHIGGEAWKDTAVQNVAEMIKRDWNHPSVVLWGIRVNESFDDDVFYKRTNELSKQLDATRQTGGVRCIENSHFFEDVYTMNDFSHDGGELVFKQQQEITHLNRTVPYMVTECIGHMYPTKKSDAEERQMEHVLRHVRVHNTSHVREDFCGTIAWCAFDYNTHKDFGSGDRICYHGVMDMFRTKKFAADVYTSMVDPQVETVLQPVTYWARGERSIGGILPLVILTNCDYVDFTFGSKPVKRFYPDRETYKGLAHPPIVVDETMITPREIGKWGLKWEDSLFEGYVNGEKVIEKTMVMNPYAAQLTVKADDEMLCADELDATRVVLEAKDQAGNRMPFTDEVVCVKVIGAGRLVGPSSFVLTGGARAFWVETTGSAGVINIEIASERFGTQHVSIQVIQARYE